MKQIVKFFIYNRWVMMISLSLVICHLSFSPAKAQSDRQYIREGNKSFMKGDFEKAEVAYTKAVEKNDKNPQAHYNLGNALMAQQKDSAAVEQFQKAGQLETNPMRKYQSFHNTGIVCQRHKMYGEAIEAYKQALRLNPNDNETRYNLALCKHEKQKQDQNNQNQQQQQQQQNKDDKQEQQKQDQQQQQQKQDQQQQQQQQQPKMSKENAEQLLQAAMQEEKQTQQRMKEAQKQGQRRQNEKNW